MHPTLTALNLLVLVELMLCGCAIFGVKGETLQRAKNYNVTVPSSWTAQTSNQESDRAFKTSTGNTATLTSSCEQKAGMSLEVLTRHLLLGARNTVFLKEESHTVSGEEGRYSSVKTTLEGSKFFLEIFVLKRNACVFDFTLVSNKEIPIKEQGEFVSFFKSLSYGNN